MKDPRAKPSPTTKPEGDSKDARVSPEEAVQETFALPPSPWDTEADGLKVEGVTSCLG